MSTEDNKAVVRGYIGQVWNARRLDAARQYLAEDFVFHHPQGDIDLSGMNNFVTTTVEGFPDLKIRIEDVIAEEDRVALRLTQSGTQLGEFLGVPATGKKISWSSYFIFRLDGGKIVEMWGVGDALGIMQQIGALPGAGSSQE